MTHCTLGNTGLFGCVAIAALAMAADAAPQRNPTGSAPPPQPQARSQPQAQLQSQARSQPQPRPQPQPQADADRVFCIASDHTLHAAQAGTCPSGQARVEVEAASQQILDGTREPGRSGDASAGAHNSALADLERRIDALHTSPLLTVVDQQKRPMMAVRPGGLVVYDETGAPVATMRAEADGGSITATSSSGLSATLSASSTEAGLWITEQNVLRLRLTGQPRGTYAFAVPTPGASGTIAGIGESKASSGAMIVASPSGAIKASVTVSDDKGMAGIFNGSGVAVLSLTEGASGGGLLALGNAQGEPTLKMGVKNNRYGVVLTGPRAGFPLVTGSGLPGSYILGCAAGPACEP